MLYALPNLRAGRCAKTKGKQTMAEDQDELTKLRTENDRLITLLKVHGIEWRVAQPTLTRTLEYETSQFTAEKKISIFRRLFRGRADAFPVRWESKNGRSGYSPACQNEWKPGVCEKPRIKCSECSNRLLIPVSDQIIFDHLAGRHILGVYPLLADETCHFLAVDFDETEWRGDAKAFANACHELGVPVAL